MAAPIVRTLMKWFAMLVLLVNLTTKRACGIPINTSQALVRLTQTCTQIQVSFLYLKETLLSEDTKVFVDLIKAVQTEYIYNQWCLTRCTHKSIQTIQLACLKPLYGLVAQGYWVITGVVVTDDMDMGALANALHLRRYGGAIHPCRQRYLARMPRIRTYARGIQWADESRERRSYL